MAKKAAIKKAPAEAAPKSCVVRRAATRDIVLTTDVGPVKAADIEAAASVQGKTKSLCAVREELGW